MPPFSSAQCHGNTTGSPPSHCASSGHYVFASSLRLLNFPVSCFQKGDTFLAVFKSFPSSSGQETEDSSSLFFCLCNTKVISWSELLAVWVFLVQLGPARAGGHKEKVFHLPGCIPVMQGREQPLCTWLAASPAAGASVGSRRYVAKTPLSNELGWGQPSVGCQARKSCSPRPPGAQPGTFLLLLGLSGSW